MLEESSKEVLSILRKIAEGSRRDGGLTRKQIRELALKAIALLKATSPQNTNDQSR